MVLAASLPDHNARCEPPSNNGDVKPAASPTKIKPSPVVISLGPEIGIVPPNGRGLIPGFLHSGF